MMERKEIKTLENIVNEYIKVIEELLILQDEKIEALKENRDDELETFINKDQAFFMKMKGIDIKLTEFQKKTDTVGLSCKEMIENVEMAQEDKYEIWQKYDKLDDMLEHYKKKSDIVKSLLEIKERSVEIMSVIIGERHYKEEKKSGIYDKKSERESNVKSTGKFNGKRV